jgi:hypothetical protein
LPTRTVDMLKFAAAIPEFDPCYADSCAAFNQPVTQLG